MPQSLSHLIVHVVFSTKNRANLLPYGDARFLTYTRDALREMQCECVEVGGTPSHLHVLLVMHRTVALSDVVGKLKANTSLWLHRQGPGYSTFQWQAGYGAFSIGMGEIEQVREYVRHQEEHHRVIGYEPELRRLFSEHGIAYDERYVWD